MAKKRNGFLQDSDYGVRQFFLDSQAQGAEACGNYNPSFPGLNKASNGDVFPQGGEDPQPPLASSVQEMLDSIKRTLSFGGLDEFPLLQPSKRLHIGGNPDEQSPTNSASMSSFFPEFLL